MDMGRHVEVSHLTDDECRHILNVITKDFGLRKTEHQRVRQLQRKLDEMKRVIAIKSSRTSKHLFGDCCMVCGSNLLKFCCVFNRGRDCLSCQNEVCSACRKVLRNVSEDHFLCLLCIKRREVKRKSAEWYYEAAEKRFKRFGSSKTLRAMHRQRDNVEPRVITLLALMKDLSFETGPSTPLPLSSLLESKHHVLFESAQPAHDAKGRPRSRSSSEIMLSALGHPHNHIGKMRKTSASSVEQGYDIVLSEQEQLRSSRTKREHLLSMSKSCPVSSNDMKRYTSTSGSSESSDEKTLFTGNVLTEVKRRIKMKTELYTKI